jgi:hypothetical protein
MASIQYVGKSDHVVVFAANTYIKFKQHETKEVTEQQSLVLLQKPDFKSSDVLVEDDKVEQMKILAPKKPRKKSEVVDGAQL